MYLNAALCSAVFLENYPLINLLLKSGANINAHVDMALLTAIDFFNGILPEDIGENAKTKNMVKKIKFIQTLVDKSFNPAGPIKAVITKPIMT